MPMGFLQGQKSRPTDSESDELHEMANLFPRTTGLPMTVWVGPSVGARHDARVTVSLTPGRMDIANTAVVGIRPHSCLIQGTLPPGDLAAVQEKMIPRPPGCRDNRLQFLMAVECRPGRDLGDIRRTDEHVLR